MFYFRSDGKSIVKFGNLLVRSIVDSSFETGLITNCVGFLWLSNAEGNVLQRLQCCIYLSRRRPARVEATIF